MTRNLPKDQGDFIIRDLCDLSSPKKHSSDWVIISFVLFFFLGSWPSGATLQLSEKVYLISDPLNSQGFKNKDPWDWELPIPSCPEVDSCSAFTGTNSGRRETWF